MINPDFNKHADGLMPAIVQDDTTGIVLMLGYMNSESYQQTLKEKKLVFFSRSRQKLWMKGETSGNFLYVKDILCDCDNDTLLVKVHPAGPVCHTGADTCFKERNKAGGFVAELEEIIASRKNNADERSYVAGLFDRGINKIAQKVGEEAVELVIESKDNDDNKFINEAADLLFHYLILLQAKEKRLQDVVDVLAARHHQK